jgi:hypothetical protein
VGAKVIAIRTAPPGIKAEFAAWYFSPHRRGTQGEWARAHGVHPTTLSIWRGEAWFADVAAEWQRLYSARFGDVVRALYLRALDLHDPQGVRAAHLLAELLGKFQSTATREPRDLFSWLATLGFAEREGETDGD